MNDKSGPIADYLGILLGTKTDPVEVRVNGSEYAVVSCGRALIHLQWHHDESSIAISPEWCADVAHTTFPFAVACFVAGRRLLPMSDTLSEVEFIADHLDAVRSICADEDTWVAFKTSVASILELRGASD